MRKLVGVAVLLGLTGCGVSGGSDAPESGSGAPSGNETSPSGTSTAGGDGGSSTGGSGGSTVPDNTTGGGSGSGTGDGSGGSGEVVVPGKISVNLPFECPADQNSFIGCWISEFCGTDFDATMSYRTVLWFDTTATLKVMRLEWGEAGCPADVAPSVTAQSPQPSFEFGALVETTTEGVNGYLLDLDSGATRTVVGDIPQLRQFGVQRLCVHEGHYLPELGIVTGVQRAATGPYVIDNTQCLQRHLGNE